MGSFIEINDTLQITVAQGFPESLLDIEKHRKNPVQLEDVEGILFTFKNKPRARIYQSDPVRVYYVHNIDDKWLFWGRILIQSQQIDKVFDKQGQWQGDWMTSGTYHIIDVYDPDYQETFTRREAPPDRNYFLP